MVQNASILAGSELNNLSLQMFALFSHTVFMAPLKFTGDHLKVSLLVMPIRNDF